MPSRKISYILKQFSKLPSHGGEVGDQTYLLQRVIDSSAVATGVQSRIHLNLKEKNQENISSYSELMDRLAQLKLQQARLEFFFFKNLKKKNIAALKNVLHQKISQDSIIFSLTERLSSSQKQYMSVINLLNSLKKQKFNNRDFILEEDLQAQSVILLNYMLHLYSRIKTRKMGLLLIMYQKPVRLLFDERKKKNLFYNLQKLKNA